MDKIMKYINKSSTLEEVNAFINEATLVELDNTNDTLFKKHLRYLDKKAKAKMLKVAEKSFDSCIDELIEIAKSVPDDEEVL